MLCAKEEAPREPTTLQMWNCLKTDTLPVDMVRALSLLRDTSTTTCLTEKGHGQGAAVIKKHRTYCESSLLGRSQKY